MDAIVTFGEIMMRVAPEGFLRFRQSLPGKVDITFAGAEANVAASISMLGHKTRYVTALPKHAVADACVDTLRGLGVDTDNVLRVDKGRLGVYYLETGANQHPSNVIYDREHSSVSLASPQDYDWKAIFVDASWLHISGITPALSRIAAETSIFAVNKAKECGVTVSCDLNFRKKLWQWDDELKPQKLAERTMREILPFVDVLIGNEEDASDVLGIKAGDTDVHSGHLETDRYPEVAKKIIGQFPDISKVAITLRESISATHNNWGAMLYDKTIDKAYFAPMSDNVYSAYQIKNIVDRVGSGDSFAAGLIFAMTTKELSPPQTAISFAVAASCLAHSMKGDFNYSTRIDVEALMSGSASGRVIR